MQQPQTWTIDDIEITQLRSPYARTWVAIGSEVNIKHLLKQWDVMLRFNLAEIPEDRDIYWDLANKVLLSGRRDTVRITNGNVEVDRRRLKEFRDGCDWLFDMLADEHAEEHYEWTEFLRDWTRKDDAPQPITELEDARRAIDILDVIFEISADNLVRLSDREVA